MSSGVARNKASATWYGADGLGLFAQVSLFQTLLLTLSTAGVVTAARVILTEPDLAGNDLASRVSWFFWCPPVLACAAALPMLLLAEPINRLLLNTAANSQPLIAAVASVPVAVAAQTAVAIAQALGDHRRLVAASAAAVIIGPTGVVALMASGSYALGSLSYAWPPATQLALLLLACRSTTKHLRNRPKLHKGVARFVFRVAGASFFLGLAATASDLFTRSLVVDDRGLAEIARYQVAAFVSLQCFGLLLSATATSILVQVRKVEDRKQLVQQLSAVTLGLISVWGIAVSLTSLFSPFLVGTLFSSQLLNAIPVLLLTLSVEPIRATAWCYGSLFLPLGWTRAWITIGLCTVLTQLVVSILLIESLGSVALALGYAAGNGFSATATTIALRRRGMSVSLRPLALSLGLFGLVSSSSYLTGQQSDLTIASVIVLLLALGISTVALLANSDKIERIADGFRKGRFIDV